jgi:hypothetical protein
MLMFTVFSDTRHSRTAWGVITIVTTMMCAVLLGGCTSSDAKVSASKLNVINPRLVTIQETGERSFSATLVNENKRPVSIVQVEVALYDASGARAGTTMIEVENVPADAEKDFRSVIDVNYDVARAKVLSIFTP